MKKFFSTCLAVAMMAIVCVGAASCSSSSDDDPQDVLTVSATELSLLAENGSSASFSIGSNGAWTISSPASWLNLSSKSGNGNATIIVTALSGNASAEVRTATLTVQCGSETKTITVSQNPLYAGASVSFDTGDMVALTNSVAIKVACTSDVKYYYARLTSQNYYSTKTDDEIVADIVALGDDYRNEPSEDDVWDIGGRTANTTYTIYAVAFDSKGKRGPLTKTDVKTAQSQNNRPSVYYSNLTYSSSRWNWETSIGPYAKQYYMIADSGLEAVYDYYLCSDAGIAYIIKNSVARGKLTPIVQNGSWYITRGTGDNDFYSAAWAQDGSGNFSPVLDWYYADLDASSKPYKAGRAAEDGRGHHFSLSDVADKVTVYSNN